MGSSPALSVTPPRYREVDVAGAPRELGRQLGESARDEIGAFIELTLDDLLRRADGAVEEALRVAAESVSFVERYSAEMAEELRGIAAGAGRPLEHLALLQVRNQLDSLASDACTSLAGVVADGPDEGVVVAQNWDNDPRLDPFIIVLTRRPEGRPPIMTVGPAGLIAYIGLTGAGLAACLNTLPAPRAPRGVPHYYTLRAMYGSRSFEGALAELRRAQRVVPANIMLGWADGTANLEVTVDEVHVLHAERGRGFVTHTNHCRHPELAAVAAGHGDLAQSAARQRRIDEVLDGAAVRSTTIATALRDHDAHPRSICRHQNDDPGTGSWRTVFSVILEPQHGRMRVARGNPCERPYESYRLG